MRRASRHQRWRPPAHDPRHPHNGPTALPRSRAQVDLPDLVRTYKKAVQEYFRRQSSPRAANLPFADTGVATSPSSAAMRQVLSPGAETYFELHMPSEPVPPAWCAFVSPLACTQVRWDQHAKFH